MRKLYLILLLIMVLFPSCKSTIIYVNKNNTSGPWDGSAKYPFKTIQEGIDATQLGSKEVVEIFSGIYNENVVMKPGITIRRAIKETKTTMIIGNNSSPAILAKDNCAIADLSIDGGNTSILVELNATMTVQNKEWTSIANCRIYNDNAIHLKTPSNLSFGNGVRRTPKINISDNWLMRDQDPAGGNGILCELTGPKTGELSIYLQIKGNVIREKFTGINIKAKGQGPNPSIVRAEFIGTIENNLIIYGNTGIRLESNNLGSAEPAIINNTIAKNFLDGIIAVAEIGPDGDASTHPDIINNIIAENNGYGYKEFGKKTSAKTFNHNLFYKNMAGHYYDEQSLQAINTQAALNTPIVSGKVVFISGSGNLVADPHFVQGDFSWNGTNMGKEPEGAYFLMQTGTTKSTAVDSGINSAKDAGLNLMSTSTDYSFDTGKADLGFHYTKPWKS